MYPSNVPLRYRTFKYQVNNGFFSTIRRLKRTISKIYYRIKNGAESREHILHLFISPAIPGNISQSLEFTLAQDKHNYVPEYISTSWFIPLSNLKHGK